jgi:hypothetical protein
VPPNPQKLFFAVKSKPPPPPEPVDPGLASRDAGSAAKFKLAADRSHNAKMLGRKFSRGKMPRKFF